MTEERVPPHNISAEESLIGALLLSRTALETALPLVTGADFYRPAHRFIFDAITELHAQGEPVDPVTVCNILRRDGVLEAAGGPGALVTLQSNTPSTTSAQKYARIIVEHSSLRQVIRLCVDVADAAYDAPDVGDLIETLQTEAGAIDIPLVAEPTGLWTVDDFLLRPATERPEWYIRGLLRDGWRVVIVAAEGFGKSLLLQQLALAPAQGIHPFDTTLRIPPITTLLVDCENPDDRLVDGFKMITDPLMSAAGSSYTPGGAWLWSRPGGIDLRHRADRAALEAVIAKVRPQVVCAGPIYKTYRSKANESDEIIAREVTSVWDDLRTRYHFALVLEHHAPKAQGGLREMIPRGSGLWLQWPEFGLSMKRDPKRNGENQNDFFLVGRHRGDRISTHAWPDGLEKSTTALPWVARWDTDHWKQLMYDLGEVIHPPHNPIPDDDDDDDPF